MERVRERAHRSWNGAFCFTNTNSPIVWRLHLIPTFLEALLRCASATLMFSWVCYDLDLTRLPKVHVLKSWSLAHGTMGRKTVALQEVGPN